MDEEVFVRDTFVTSGSVDILAAYNWEVANGWASASQNPTQLEYGTEIAATTGTQTFPVNDVTFNLSTTNGHALKVAPPPQEREPHDQLRQLEQGVKSALLHAGIVFVSTLATQLVALQTVATYSAARALVISAVVSAATTALHYLAGLLPNAAASENNRDAAVKAAAPQ